MLGSTVVRLLRPAFAHSYAAAAATGTHPITAGECAVRGQSGGEPRRAFTDMAALAASPLGGAFSLDESDGVLRVRLGSNPLNTLTSDRIAELESGLSEGLQQPAVRCLHLESAVRGMFSMGLDPEHVCALPGLRERVQLFERLLTLFRTVYSAPVPSSVVVSGGAYAGGAVLAIACDKRVFLPAGAISFSEVKVGLPVPRCIQNVVRDAVQTHGDCMELCTFGVVQDAATALRCGVATDLARDEPNAEEIIGNFHSRAMKLSRTVLQKALHEYKRANIAELDSYIEDLKKGEESRIAEFLTEEFLLEGLSSLCTQSPPTWTR